MGNYTARARDFATRARSFAAELNKREGHAFERAARKSFKAFEREFASLEADFQAGYRSGPPTNLREWGWVSDAQCVLVNAYYPFLRRNGPARSRPAASRY